MKKIINIFMALIFMASTLNAEVYNVDGGTNKGKMVKPLQNLIETTQWDLFMTEFEIKLDVGECGEGMKYALGLKARMIEPIGYFETTKKRLNFPFAGFTIDEGSDKTSVENFDGSSSTNESFSVSGSLSKIMQFGNSRKIADNDNDQGGRNDIIWSHFIYVPIFGLLFKKKLKFLCLSGGDIALPILSEFLPPYTKDIMYKNMIGQMLIMFSPQGLISSIMNCAAVMGVNSMHDFVSGENGSMTDSGTLTSFLDETEAFDPNNQGTTSKPSDSVTIMDQTEEFLNSIRNTMYWNVGCLGFAPVGGYIPAADPGTDNELVAYGMMNLLHGASSILPAPFLYKQTNFSVSGIPSSGDGRSVDALDTMCEPHKYPMMIESQYVFQRAGIPTIGRAHSLGVSAAVSTTAANLPDAKDDWVNLVWQYRDYYAFAYFCPDVD